MFGVQTLSQSCLTVAELDGSVIICSIMTTCSSSSDNADSTSTSDIEDGFGNTCVSAVSLDHDELNSSNRYSDDVALNAAVLSDATQRITSGDLGCGDVTEIDVKQEVENNSFSGSSESGRCKKLREVVALCPANGLVSEIPALPVTSVSCETKVSSNTANAEDSVTLAVGKVVPVLHSDASCGVDSEVKPSLANSIPLLSIPHTEHSCNSDSGFSMLSSFTPEERTVQLTSSSVFSVPCKESADSFTDVNLDDDNDDRAANTVNASSPVAKILPATSEPGHDVSPGLPQMAEKFADLQIRDAIVQSVLRDDDDGNDISAAVGSSRHSAAVAFSTNANSASFRTPSCAPADAIGFSDDDGLHVVEPDSASFEEISLQSSSASVDFRSMNADADQSEPSDSKRGSLGIASFFARQATISDLKFRSFIHSDCRLF